MGILDIFKTNTEATPTQNSPEPQPAPPPAKTILIVDDEEFILDSYREMLQSDGYTVLTATNGQEGFEKALQNKPNIILLDITMPIMDGKTMFQKVKTNPTTSQIPIIFLTNSGNTTNLMFSKDHSADGFFIKSNYDPNEVVQKVKEVLTAKELETKNLQTSQDPTKSAP
jgi:twitching motility two-component system response regulator PilH